MLNLGEYVSNVIEEQGRNNKWVAEKLGIKYRTFNAQLKNNNLGGEDFLKIAKLLGIDVNKLLEKVE